MKQALLAATLMIAASATPCINDRDTLAFEQRNVDAIKRVRQETNHRKRAEAAQEIALKAIGGRFERFPAKYYEMRIARLEALAHLHVLEYDDLAVAYERLGKTDKAIEILLASKPHRKTKDDDYRFHANYGTFLVHKWLAQKDRADKKALKQSIAEIEAALKINPGSHFGREKVQLELERMWLTGESLEFEDEIDHVVGLAGIAMMGLAYELPDAYALMTDLNLVHGTSIFDGLVVSRVRELVADGHNLVSQELVVSKPKADPKGEIGNAYKDLRADGEKVHQARLAYIDERLNRGEHPDTHPDFWKEWQEPPFPVLNRINPLLNSVNQVSIMKLLLGVGAMVSAIAITIWRRRVKKVKLLS